MDPQHLARLDDDGSVRRIRTGTAGGSATRTPPPSPEVPVSAPVGTAVLDRPTETVAGALSDAWPLPVGRDGDPLPDARTVLDAEAVVAAVARGPRNRRPSLRGRRPAVYLAAVLIGAAGVGVTTASDSSLTAQADEPVSVAEELGLVQAEQPVLSHEAATSRLQELAASRAQREDAQAAAAQVQADADAAAAARAAADAAAAAEAARPRAVLPVQGARLSSGFGYRWGTLHAGMDFAAPIGTPEYAAADGVVLRAGAASGFGLAVYIQHENGDVTVYGHMEQILVAEGQTVKAGDTIALLGNRGESTGPHLHFEVHIGGIDGEKVDPLPWLRDRGVAI